MDFRGPYSKGRGRKGREKMEGGRGVASKY